MKIAKLSFVLTLALLSVALAEGQFVSDDTFAASISPKTNYGNAIAVVVTNGSNGGTAYVPVYTFYGYVKN